MDNSSQSHNDKVIDQCSQSLQEINATNLACPRSTVPSSEDDCNRIHDNSGYTSPMQVSSSKSSVADDQLVSENDKSTMVPKDLVSENDISMMEDDTPIKTKSLKPSINPNGQDTARNEIQYAFFSDEPNTQLLEPLEHLGSGNSSPTHSSVSGFTPNDDHEYSVHAKAEKLGRIMDGLETFGALEDSLTPTQRILLEGVRQEICMLCKQEKARRLFVLDGLFVHGSTEKMLEGLGVFKQLKTLLEGNKHITSDDTLKFLQTTRADQHMEMVHALLEDLRRTYTALGTLEARVDALKFSRPTLKTHRAPETYTQCPSWPCIFWRADGCNNRVFTESSACFRHKDIKLVRNGLVMTPWA